MLQTIKQTCIFYTITSDSAFFYVAQSFYVEVNPLKNSAFIKHSLLDIITYLG